MVIPSPGRVVYFDCPAQTSRSQLKLIAINHYLLTSSVPPSAW